MVGLVRTGVDGVVAPLPLVTKQLFAIRCSTAGACCNGLLADGATRNCMLVPFARHSKRKASRCLRQPNRHGGCKQRYSNSLQHDFSSLGETKLKTSVLVDSPFFLALLRLPVGAQPFPNCSQSGGQQNDDGDADSKTKAVVKQDHS